jgi:hypothetical protein
MPANSIQTSASLHANYLDSVSTNRVAVQWVWIRMVYFRWLGALVGRIFGW